MQQSKGVYKLYLYDDITAKEYDWFSVSDSETSAKHISKQLDEIPDGSVIELHINSNGGDANEGVAIYNALKQKNAQKTAYIDGAAYSAAFLPALGCDRIVAGLGSTALIHNMWTMACGNANDLRMAADQLDTMMASNRQIFLNKTGKSMTESDLVDLMSQEKMLTPKELMAFGLIDEIDGEDDGEEKPEHEEPDGDEPSTGEPDGDEGGEPMDPEPDDIPTDDPEDPEDPKKTKEACGNGKDPKEACGGSDEDEDKAKQSSAFFAQFF
jgi:ATP-dependent protease ClpP protease subunit